MSKVSAETWTTFQHDVRASNLPRASKALALELPEKITELEAQLAKLKEQEVNKTTNQPSGKKPEWGKGQDPNPKGGGKASGKGKLGGSRNGSGNRPKKELTPDTQIHNKLEQCPHCNTPLRHQTPVDTNTRVIEDIAPPAEKTIITEETSDRKWCPTCQKIVSAKSELALEGSDIGLNAMVLMVWFWVVPAMSLPNIVGYLSCFMRLYISTSGISKLLIRIAKILLPVQEEILSDIRSGGKLWADETGWRVRGVTWWLWAFANEISAYYFAAPSRGSPVLFQIIGEVFLGVLITDGWGAYNLLPCLFRQTCMAHIFRKIRHLIEQYPELRSLLRFYSKLKQILKDGEKLRDSRKAMGEKAFWQRYELLKQRLQFLLSWPNPNSVLTKVIATIRRQEEKILTFVLLDGIPNHNNYGEYVIRKGVLKRKISGGSMSERGAQAYATLNSIAQTCHLRKISFIKFLMASLLHYIRTGRPMLLSEYAALNDQNKKAA